MNAIIKKIVLFKEDGEMRDVPLQHGLNIITGDSKTGKSALIEIVDYCLFSTRSTIPVGKITEFSNLYCVILQVSGKYLVIARPRWGEHHTHAYLSIETNEAFINSFNYEYFSNKEPRRIKYDVITELEEHLGLSVLDTRTDGVEDKRSAGKATMRSFVPFLFQHQNLIASKHSLFYRFDDMYKRKDTVDQFPILMGWVDSEYYSVKRLYEDKVKTLRAEEKRLKRFELSKEEQINRLRVPIEQYFTSIGRVLPEDLSLRKLQAIARELPNVPKSSFEDSDVEFELFELNDKISNCRSELSEVKKLIKQVSENSIDANSYGVKLQTIVSNHDSLNSEIESVECPLCHNKTPETLEIIHTLNDSKEKLMHELLNVGNYRNDSTEHLESLLLKETHLKRNVRLFSVKIKALEETKKEIEKDNKLRDGLNFLRGQVQSILNHILDEPTLGDSTIDLDELRDEISILKEKISGYDLDAKYQDANTFLSEKMTEISMKLDFESELQPGTMRFDLKTFNFYYNFKNSDILLSEMGSGANWLASHLSLFLGLLHLNCKEKKSVIPSFLFIDQPSQVYFPKATRSLNSEVGAIKDDDDRKEADENIVQVKNIFKVINEELKEMHELYESLPQIVVLEHADEEELDKYVIKRWSSKGEKLI